MLLILSSYICNNYTDTEVPKKANKPIFNMPSDVSVHH